MSATDKDTPTNNTAPLREPVVLLLSLDILEDFERRLVPDYPRSFASVEEMAVIMG